MILSLFSFSDRISWKCLLNLFYSIKMKTKSANIIGDRMERRCSFIWPQKASERSNRLPIASHWDTLGMGIPHTLPAIKRYIKTIYVYTNLSERMLIRSYWVRSKWDWWSSRTPLRIRGVALQSFCRGENYANNYNCMLVGGNKS